MYQFHLVSHSDDAGPRKTDYIIVARGVSNNWCSWQKLCQLVGGVIGYDVSHFLMMVVTLLSVMATFSQPKKPFKCESISLWTQPTKIGNCNISKADHAWHWSTSVMLGHLKMRHTGSLDDEDSSSQLNVKSHDLEILITCCNPHWCQMGYHEL